MDSTTTLPDVKHYQCDAFEVKEASDDREMHDMIWSWHLRRPGFTFPADAGPDSYIGPEWRNYCFYFDGTPLVCVSAEEKRAYGYEIHVAAAPGCHPKYVRQSIKWVGDLLTRNPCRMASWCPAYHRAAVRLNRQFLRYERDFTTDDGTLWRGFGADQTYWNQRHNNGKQNETTAV